MKKGYYFVAFFAFSIFAFLTSINFVSAFTYTVDAKSPVVISELNNPAVFTFNFNSADKDSVEIYSFLGVSFSPKGTFDVPAGESKVEVKAYPDKSVRKHEGIYKFEYQLKGLNGITKDSLSINIASLESTLEFGAENLQLRDKVAQIVIKNTQNTYLDNVKVHLSSVFFDVQSNFSLKPYEQIKVPVNLNMLKTKTLLAGPYVFKADVEIENAEKSFEGVIKYVEKETIITKKEDSGLIVRKNSVSKINDGNTRSVAQIEIDKDIFSRLFTTHSREPIDIQRKGLMVQYIWEKELEPSESLEVTTTSNYTLPFIFVILIVVIAVSIKIYLRTSLVLSKKVSFVRTRGGEFALKVRLHVKAKKYVENIQVVDMLPGMTQLFEKFGIKPDRIDAATRRLFWKIDRLNAGEERVYSYVVYSKVRIVGRFELPSAMAVYQREGENHEVSSNRAFFVSDTVREE